MTNSGIWYAIDCLAAKLGKSCSALAKECGLDSTIFNKSKRFDKYGKPHWPSCHTISKLLDVTGVSEADFFKLAASSTCA
ncbi:MAG: hypothetical protein MJ187_02585 [Alphaproteobacteria bacterium]|nr:hypothetical protein [Alphaproteobacteria bacterium]